MKPYQSILGLSLILLLASCVNRETNDEKNEVELDDTTERITEDDMYKTPAQEEADTMDVRKLNELYEAKSVMNDYFDALRRDKAREAYDMMDPDGPRGTFSKFSEKYNAYEKLEVTFSDDAQVLESNGEYTITIPLRYSGTTNAGNIESYTGSATLMRSNVEDSEYTITTIEATRDDS